MEKLKNRFSFFLFSALVSFAPIPTNLFCQTETLSTSLCGQAPAGTPCPGATLVELYDFAYNITSGNPSFTGIVNWTTSGTYTAADITGFTIYVTTFCVFNTTTPLQTIAASGPGTHTFAFADPLPAAPSQRYFWITTNFTAGAVPGRTIQINIITAAMTTITGTETFGTNTIGGLQTICNSAPIELTSFTGKHFQEMNVLEWTTASETNNDFFTVEKSIDGINFFEFQKVAGAGNSNSEISYEIKDNNLENNLTYYRLKQTDFNGDFEYSKVIVVNSSEQEKLKLFPNPCNGSFEILNDSEKPVTIKIMNSIGEILMNIKYTSGKIDISSLPHGLYFVLNESNQTLSMIQNYNLR